MPYPKGAISSINELLTYADKPIWSASRVHSRGRPEKQLFTGEIFTQKFDDGWLFHGYRWRHPDNFNVTSSLLDKHVIAHPNGDYNDWYLFGNEADVEAYLAGA